MHAFGARTSKYLRLLKWMDVVPPLGRELQIPPLLWCLLHSAPGTLRLTGCI